MQYPLRLSLWGTDVADLSPLKHLRKLKWLSVRETNVADLSPLEGLQSLKGIGIDYDVACRNESVVEKLKKRGVKVHW